MEKNSTGVKYRKQILSVSMNCTLEKYVILLNTVTPINLIEKVKNKKIFLKRQKKKKKRES